ncbi:MAG TPA: polysaccharide pyruvyl transferase family protein [Gammaproteobacteria bacterium]|nr:polysaccharide pyruvyl transferase family protein [Gammaproteobacteria bacterium]
MLNAMNKSVDLFWPSVPRPGNVGDILTPWMLLKSSIQPRWVSKDSSNKILGIGSIARWAKPGDHVWGAGIFNRTDYLTPEAIYHAVRGPLTRQRVLDCGGKCPEIYGDPALLLPRLLDTTNIPIQYKLGVVPHYADQASFDYSLFPPDTTTFINVLNARPEYVIAHICSCERIISSSLHGIIIAHAYNIPARWVQFTDRLHGDDVKFLDYFLSISIEPYDPVMPPDFDESIEPVNLTIDLDAIWDARPWK